MKSLLLALLVCILIIGGCIPAPPNAIDTPTIAPTDIPATASINPTSTPFPTATPEDPQAIISAEVDAAKTRIAIETAVAATLTAESLPSQPASATSTPMYTPTSEEQLAIGSLDALIDRKLPLTVGYSYETGPYSYDERTTGSPPMGFEVALLQEINKRWANGGENAFTWTGIRMTQRELCANSRECDIVVGAVKHNQKRCNIDDDTWSTICTETRHTYDLIGMMLNHELLTQTLGYQFIDVDSNVYCEYFDSETSEPRQVGVVTGTSAANITTLLFQNVCEDLDDRLFPSPDNGGEIAYQGRLPIVNAVANEEIIAYFTDGSILRFYGNQVASDKLIFKSLGEFVPNLEREDYIFLLPEGHEKVQSLLDWTMQAMICDGTYERIYQIHRANLDETLMTELIVQHRNEFACIDGLAAGIPLEAHRYVNDIVGD